jgi:1-acyl-sn-glycerol-3-phosphate acyltransferase
VIFLRSSLFNLLFYGLTAVMAVACLPVLLLPRGAVLGVVHAWCALVTALERHVAGIDYEVRGREHIPAAGPYLVAAKHLSPYETMKIHLIFRDPAIVLKKELMRIPLWGWYAARVGLIPIDRGRRGAAMDSLICGAKARIAQGRPVVLFPQGTRVDPYATPAERPYKAGIARLQAATGLPILPMALNSGLFWPRKGWMKYPGTVVFSLLPPIAPGADVPGIMARVESQIEAETRKLLDEARPR